MEEKGRPGKPRGNYRHYLQNVTVAVPSTTKWRWRIIVGIHTCVYTKYKGVHNIDTMCTFYRTTNPSQPSTSTAITELEFESNDPHSPHEHSFQSSDESDSYLKLMICLKLETQVNCRGAAVKSQVHVLHVYLRSFHSHCMMVQTSLCVLRIVQSWSSQAIFASHTPQLKSCFNCSSYSALLIANYHPACTS